MAQTKLSPLSAAQIKTLSRIANAGQEGTLELAYNAVRSADILAERGLVTRVHSTEKWLTQYFVYTITLDGQETLRALTETPIIEEQPAVEIAPVQQVTSEMADHIGKRLTGIVSHQLEGISYIKSDGLEGKIRFRTDSVQFAVKVDSVVEFELSHPFPTENHWWVKNVCVTEEKTDQYRGVTLLNAFSSEDIAQARGIVDYACVRDARRSYEFYFDWDVVGPVLDMGSDTPTIVHSTAPVIEIETNGVLVGEVAKEIECACGLKFWSLDSDHVQCDACDEAAADFESDMRLNEALIGTEKPRDPSPSGATARRYDAVVIARSATMNEAFVFIRSTSFGFAIRIDAGEWLAKFLLTGDEITFAQNWDWTHNPRAIDIKRKEKPVDPSSEYELVMGSDKYSSGIYQLGEMETYARKIDPRDAEIERLKRELAQAIDERDEAQTQVAKMKMHLADKRTARDEAEDSGPTDGPDAWGNFNIDEEDSFDPWEDERYQDRGEAGKGIFFG